MVENIPILLEMKYIINFLFEIRHVDEAVTQKVVPFMVPLYIKIPHICLYIHFILNVVIFI